ncbi:MAG TPA: 30S ribosome-binding factor RbfA [Anaerolineae bacterium]|nr:30S ribosome-binding factor RbfA [Anaerolineae bacterium]
MTTRRQLRVAGQIHRELSTLLLFEARDPRLAGVTITGVDITPDLLIAHVYFTLLGTEEEKGEASAALEHAKGYLRTQVAARIQQRLAPELLFHLDRSVEQGARIDSILDRLRDQSLSDTMDGSQVDGADG